MATCVYPITADYVADWDVPRAVAELVANAYDTGASPSVCFRDGLIEVSDRGPGIPPQALAFGYSTKSGADIGQFGEGAKIALLVLARTLGPDSVVVHTVGWSATARIESRPVIEGTDPLDVLVVELTASSRRSGTKVLVKADEQLWQAVRQRFLRLRRRWSSPASGAVVVPGETGRVYVGGVLVAADRDLVASYDLSLSDAKHLQNRDRSVVDGFALERLIRVAQAQCSDRTTVAAWLGAVLSGALPSLERDLPSPSQLTPAAAAAWRAVRRSSLPGRVCWRSSSTPAELELVAQDRGWTVLAPRGDTWSFERVMALCAVPPVAEAVRAGTLGVRFVSPKRLNEERRAVLSSTLRTARRLWGAELVGRVRLYETAGEGCDGWAGFFNPAGDVVALHVSVLDDRSTAMGTLLHELAHRHAHRAGTEFADRSRGFEEALGTLGALAALRR